MKNYLKFGLLIVAVLGTLAWLAVGGISETKTYYKTVAELKQLGNQAQEKRLRVGGDIAPHSIVRQGANVSFTLAQDKLRMDVVYSGMADGKLGADGVFHATKIQAKCASKYEAKPVVKGNPSVRS
jgi:cytochrome c-type biogenesis protein CcmE